MPTERHIEKLLQAFARKRREQAGESLELHPATRRMLRGEVARQLARPTPDPASKPRLWTVFWPRVAFSGALLAVLVLGVFLFLPPPNQSQSTLTFAKQESIAAQPTLEVQPPPAAAPSVVSLPRSEAMDKMERSRFAAPSERDAIMVAPAVAPMGGLAGNAPAYFSAASRDKGLVTESGPAVFSDQKPAAPSYARPAATPDALRLAEAKSTPAMSPPAGAGAVVTAQPVTSRAAGQSYGARSEGQTPLPVRRVTTAEAASGSALAREAGSQSLAASAAGRAKSPVARPSAAPATAARTPSLPTIVQAFARTDFTPPPDAGRGTQGHAVLASFQFEQSGQEIRILDQDGSVYVGTIEAATAPPLKARLEQESVRKLNTPKAQAMAPSNEITGVEVEARGGAPAALTFRVRGTNTTLNQTVVFVGNLQPQVGAGQLGLSDRAGSVAAVSPQPARPASQYQNARITGRAQLADGTQLEIKALATPR